MNIKLFESLVKWPKPFISGTDLHQMLNKSPASRQGIIKRSIHEGYLLPIRRDLYLIKSPKSSLIDTFEIAPIIYGPSYTSFESALSFHNWIPEAVRTTTCATVKRTKEFETTLGIFSYEHIPMKAFPLGIEQIKQKNGTLFIASSVKAIADMIYARKRFWDNAESLFEDLRIEPDSIKDSDRTILNELIEWYPSKRVKKGLLALVKGF